MSYKWCVVPECTNTSINTQKLFVCVPKHAKMRRNWLQLAHRNPDDLVENSTVFFCEDHFDMEKDMANYCQYKMGFSQRIVMVNGVLPSKFHCQHEHRKRLNDGSTSTQLTFVKQKRKWVIQEQEDIKPTVAVQEIKVEIKNEIDPLQTWEKSTSTSAIVTTDKSTQCYIKKKVHVSSKAVQTKASTSYPSRFVRLCSCHVEPYKTGFTHMKRSSSKLRELT